MKHFIEGYDFTYHETLVRIENLHLVKEGKTILRGLSGEVRDLKRPDVTAGQVVGILGPSGIGKTQLARVLTGLEEPTSGKILVGANGGSIVRPGMVGLVPQNYPLFKHRRVGEQLQMAARLSGKDQKTSTQLVAHYLGEFGIADKAENFPDELSGGQRQRAAIVRQLLSSDYYIVLDEPSTGLDPINKDRVRDLVIKLATTVVEEMTVFIISHDIPFVSAVADRLWMLGRDRDAQGHVIPGAYIREQFDLIKAGLAWQPGIERTPEFHDFCDLVKQVFATL